MFNATRTATLLAGVLAFGLSSTASIAQDARPATPDVVSSLAGIWKAPEYKIPVSTDLDISVWGRGAAKVRHVELAIEPSGTALLRVHNSVVDPRGRTKQYSASVVEARLEVTAPQSASGGAVEPPVRVISAEERYLDGTNERRTIDGLTVKLHTLSPGGNELNIRYDTAQGTGSFGETLVRSGKSGARSRTVVDHKPKASSKQAD
jgi:hypothetical protein